MKPILALAIALSLGTAAHAKPVAVRYADLNLSSVAGQAELERRIESATRQVCYAEPTPGTRIVDRKELNRCHSSVRAQVNARIGESHPQVAARLTR